MVCLNLDGGNINVGGLICTSSGHEKVKKVVEFYITLSKSSFGNTDIIIFLSVSLQIYQTFFYGHIRPLHGHFTATHGYQFSTVIHFLKLPHLRKVAATVAIWQPCNRIFCREYGT
jgi:hypothetical protein